MNRREQRTTAVALAMLAPNFLGFLVFTAGPVLFSLIMAFTDWDLTIHNAYSHVPVRFIGLENFRTLFLGHEQRYFFQYLYNTLYMMLAIPIGIALSLAAALLLNQPLPRPRGARGSAPLIWAAAIALVSCALLYLCGAPPLAIFLLAVTGVVVLLGLLFGQTAFRTLYYLPSLTSGVATFILWKALYNPETGPINRVLVPVLQGITQLATHSPAVLWHAGALVIYLLALLCFIWGLRACLRSWHYRDLSGYGAILCIIGLGAVAWLLLKSGQFLADVPAAVTASKGLVPPAWLADIIWSKPALMLMGTFMAIGSNNMLMYLAALSNVPLSLQEAAAIDGATKWQTFWNVTWPQLAPTTFFIIIMSIIGGLQGGFDQARVMTGGGPAGSTTTLSYYLYSRGFESFQLGLASAISWVMFVLIFIITMINWKFGNKMVND